MSGLASLGCTVKNCGCVHYEAGEDVDLPEACTCGHAIEEHEATRCSARPVIDRAELAARRPRRRELMALRVAADALDRPAIKLRTSGRLDFARELDRLQARLRAEARRVEASVESAAADERGST